MIETVKRTVSGLSIAGLAALALFYEHFNNFYLLLILLIAALGGLKEFYKLSRRGIHHGAPFTKTGFFFSICIILAYYADFLVVKRQGGHQLGPHYDTFTEFFAPGFSLVPLLLLLLLITASINQVIFRPVQGAVYSLAVTLFGPIYTVISLAHVLLILTLPQAKAYLILFLFLPIAADVGAYFGGRWFGAHALGFKLSPKKTYEGYLSGIAFTCFVGMAFLWTCQNYFAVEGKTVNLGYLEIFFLSLCMAVLSIFGDLIESAFKRDTEKKDSSSSIPGHGGLLDLLDTMYWSLPLGYFYLFLRQLFGVAP